MEHLIRDTVFGHSVRFISRRRLLRFPDEIDSTLLSKCKKRAELTPRSQLSTNGNTGQNREPTLPVQDDKKPDFELVGWYGLDDPENPQNWPGSHKFLIASQICFLLLFVYVGSSIYTPGELSIIKEFGVSETVATLGLCLFALGYGLGPMLFSPMSEMPQFGRRNIYFWTLLIFVVLQLPTGYAVNMPMFLVFRFLTGFFGSPVLATGGATMADMYPPSQVTYGICVWCGFGILGPELGPLIGGFVAQAKGWRWTIWTLAWLCTLVLVVLFFFMPETNADNILYRRARRLRNLTGNNRLRSHSEIDAAQSTARDHLTVLARAFTLTFLEPIVLFLDLYTALLYGVLYIWFESFPLVFGGVYGFNLGQQGLAFLGILIGSFISVPTYIYWAYKYLTPKFKSSVAPQPEVALPPTFFGTFALPVCLFFYGWTSRPEVHWIIPVIGAGFFAVALVTLFNAVVNYLGMAYPAYAASVFAGNGLMRASFGVIFPLFARALFRKLGIGPGNSLLGAISVLFIPVPFVLHQYGHRIRNASKNAQHDA